MKEKFDLLTKQLQHQDVKRKYMALVKYYEPVYVGKRVLGHNFIVTPGSLIGAAAECGETAVQLFFDGVDTVVKGKKVGEWMALYASYEVKE